MSYIVTTTSGTALATVPDNTVNTTTTSITLVGKNYAGYGVFLNENYIKILENFSNTTAPNRPLRGQLWHDSRNSLIKVWTVNDNNQGRWKSLASSAAQSFAPVEPVAGDLWWDIATTQLKVWSGSAWITVGPSIVTAIALNALAVNNISSGSFLRSDQNSNNGPHTLTAGKIQVGSELLIDPTIPSEVQIYSNGESKDLNLYVKRSGVQTKAIGITAVTAAVAFTSSISVNGINTTGTAIINGNADGQGNIGSVSQRFNTIFAKATSAQYADLAERFAADAVYAPGTVVELGGEQEITAVKDDLSEAVFGVISTNPAYLMNGNSGGNDTHPPVALSGRVPVRVVGTAKKGDRLVSAGNGLARAANNGEISPLNVIGRCLADKYYSEEGSIEAVVRLNT